MSRYTDPAAKSSGPSPVAMISDNHEKAVAYRALARRFARAARMNRKAQTAMNRANDATVAAEIAANDLGSRIVKRY